MAQQVMVTLGRDDEGFRYSSTRSGALVRITTCCGAVATADDNGGSMCKGCYAPVADDFTYPVLLATAVK